MNAKFFQWIPIVGILLVVSHRDAAELELNPLSCILQAAALGYAIVRIAAWVS